MYVCDATQAERKNLHLIQWKSLIEYKTEKLRSSNINILLREREGYTKSNQLKELTIVSIERRQQE